LLGEDSAYMFTAAVALALLASLVVAIDKRLRHPAL